MVARPPKPRLVACLAASLIGCTDADWAARDVGPDISADLAGGDDASDVERPRCAADRECGAHSRCVEGDCIDLFGQSCDNHTQCGLEDACVDDRCVPRFRTTLDFSMLPVDLAGITDRPGVAPGSGLDYSIGAGLLDVDGDRQLDIILGVDAAHGAERCIFRNVSTPGNLAFEAQPALCEPADPMTASVFGIDVDNDGRDEYLELGANLIRLHSGWPRQTSENLFDRVAELDPDRRCVAGVALPLDLDLDGLIDIVIGCQVDSFGNGPAEDRADLVDLVFLQTEDHHFAPSSDARWAPLLQGGITLALAAADLDDNGLLDIVAAADTGSAPNRFNTGIFPGGILRACAPGTGCSFGFQRFVEGVDAWGSYMGVGLLTGDDHDQIYLTNWGENRLLTPDGSGYIDLAPDLGVDFVGEEPSWQYSWAALVDDFDRNGLDDIYVSRGTLRSRSFPAQYRDVLLLQTDAMHFDPRLDVRPRRARWQSVQMPNSRGGATADFDHDGALEVVLATPDRALDVFSELPVAGLDESRCTLVPRPRVVVTYGAGYRLADYVSGAFRMRGGQGQHRFGQPAHITAPFARGVLQFPSGARVDFDCGRTPGPVVVEEPDWIGVDVVGAGLQIRLDTPWFDAAPAVDVMFDTAAGTALIAAVPDERGHFVATIPELATRAIVRIDQRWVARWWSLAD